MVTNAPTDCLAVLQTSLALIDQFQMSLSSPVNATETSQGTDYPSPLLLLRAAAETLKSTTTKLSLLCITPPFTGSAIVSLLKPLNDSILPSLVTAALLVTPSQYPDAFAIEASRIANGVLFELRSLIALIERRAKDGKPKEEMSSQEKQSITEATGRVWEHCDLIVQFSNNGVSTFVVEKAEQWLALMKDAVQELQEWDPEEDVDENLFGDIDSGGEEEDVGAQSGSKDKDQATIAAGVKEQALKVLSRIPQSIHVVVKQRLAKLPVQSGSANEPLGASHKATIDIVIKKVRDISECIDESAEAMYLGNPELCLKKAGEARALTINVVEAVSKPWQSCPDGQETKEDGFIKRALLWIQQVDTKPSNSAST